MLLSTRDATERKYDLLSRGDSHMKGVVGAVQKHFVSKGKELTGLSDLREVAMDHGRARQDEIDAEERQQAALKSGPETGIWRAEDDEVDMAETKERSKKCSVM